MKYEKILHINEVFHSITIDLEFKKLYKYLFLCSSIVQKIYKLII
jgi:hypothetical protein